MEAQRTDVYSRGMPSLNESPYRGRTGGGLIGICLAPSWALFLWGETTMSGKGEELKGPASQPSSNSLELFLPLWRDFVAQA